MRTMALIRKEFLHFWRDPILMVVVLWAFTMDVYLTATGFSLDIQAFPLAIYDMDQTKASETLLNELRPPKFRVVEMIHSEGRIDELLLSGKALMVVVVPKGFSESLARGESAKVQALLDGTNSNSAGLAMTQITNLFMRCQLKNVQTIDMQAKYLPIRMKSRVEFNPNMQVAWFVGLTEMCSSITLVAMLLPAAALVREKEYGTIEQLLVSPLRPWQITLSKIVPMMLLVIASTGLCLYAVLGAAFSVYPQGPMWFYLLSTGMYVAACSGLGMLIATFAKNLSQVMLMLTTTLVPVQFLSGSWTPIEAMPASVQWFTHLSPLYYFLDIGLGIFFKGWGVEEGLVPFFWLTVLGGSLFVFGTTRVGKQFG